MGTAEDYMERRGDAVGPSFLPSAWRRVFGIDEREGLFERRGFVCPGGDAQARLEAAGRAFIAGYREGLLSCADGPGRETLARAPDDFSGFVAEGVAMGCAIADMTSLGGRRLRLWLARTAADFASSTHAGVGWALARMPFGWATVLSQLDPIHYWLAFDGMGFHDTYFFPRRVLSGWRRRGAGYEARAYDQGVGRALWFVCGGDVERSAQAIAGLDEARAGALWAGVGHALAYVGPVDAAAATVAAGRSGRHFADFGQGVAFAAAARVKARHVPGHTRRAVEAVSGRSPESVAERVATARLILPLRCEAETPAFEAWRAAIRRHVRADWGAK
jgi:hypothetical protein